MKKTTLLTSLVFVFALLLSTNVSAQKFAKLDKSPMDAAAFPTNYKEANKLIKIIYSVHNLKEET